MKYKAKYLIVILSFIVLSCGDSKTQEEKDAEMNLSMMCVFQRPSIIEINDLIKLSLEGFSKAVDGNITIGDINKIEKSLEEIIGNINKDVKMIESTSEFDSEIPVRKTSLNYTAESKKILESDFKQFIELLKEGSNESIVKSVDVFIIVWEKLLEIQESSREVEERFMLKYSVEFINDKDRERIDESRKQFIVFKKQLDNIKNIRSH